MRLVALTDLISSGVHELCMRREKPESINASLSMQPFDRAVISNGNENI
jgi:hypothetical protein